ncbi:hypothetical protein MKK67_06030 [Methylobacterium sp. J-072]|uniref:hypothetical protein n=1 Tax=Methylobacterium sp. J-072 TaxID=2836651 RepID=UPI001FB8C575|nr:hypothetical protein [Methylobacterium sp. J-072]MCJ2092063.1 hypothetical protein [Methylobacterium sp. J-072]
MGADQAAVQALDYSGFDYTLDRIEHLELEVGRLRKELRKSRDPETVDLWKSGSVALEH